MPANTTTTDWRSDVLVFLVSWRSRLAGWRVETLHQLVQAEEEGAAMIARALPGVSSAGLHKLLSKQWHDERNHAALFSARCRALSAHAVVAGSNTFADEAALAPLDEITLVAYLELQERRALDILRAYVVLFGGDAETVVALQHSVKDEQYHAAWTRRQLERWIDAGRLAEVNAARTAARRIDRKAFRQQLHSFLRALPALLCAGIVPPVGGLKPAPFVS